MADIIDVAKLANVSKSTVSRVLNNNGYVAKSTRERIEKAMKELNYSPSSFAQNIRTHKSKTIAMMIPDSSNTFYMEIFKAVEDVALKNDYMVILCDTRRTVISEKYYAEKLFQRNVDGLIYFAQQKRTDNYFINLSKKLPIIFMDYIFADTEEINCVAMEGKSSSVEAVKYLYEKGRRKIGYVNLPKENNVTWIRCEGYQEGLKSCNLPYNPELVVLPESDEARPLLEVGYAATEELLEKNPDVDAIMAASDQLAVGILKCLRHKGKKVPQDVSVVGFDDINLCEAVSPTLTTVRQPIKEMGYSAAQMLLDIIQTGQTAENKKIYQGELIIRHSTD